MGLGWLEKIMSFMGFSDSYEDEEEEKEEARLTRSNSRGRAPVLSLHTSPEVKIIVISPKSFDEAEQLATHLKGRKSLVVNLENIPKDAAQRIIDFLSGTVFALGGSVLKIRAETFLFVPGNVSILTEGLPKFRWEKGGIKDSYQEKG